MKVLHVSTHFNIGGISNYILQLSGALKVRGVEVAVASCGGDLVPELERSGIPHYDLDIDTKFEFSPKVFRSAFRLARIVKDERVDIVHAHSRVSQVASLLASKLGGVPFVSTCHGYFKKRLRGIVDTWGMKVIAISDAVKSHLIEDLGVDEERIELVYSGVDALRFSRDYGADKLTELKSSLGLKNAPVIGTIGRLSPVKGQKYLVGAMKEILSVRPDTQVIILGDGDERESLAKLAKTLGVSGSLHLFSSCADTTDFLSVMDVFVFPSVKEGLGIALLEAMAAGKACVASRVGGISDIIKDGYSGLLVGVADQKAISSAVLELLADAELRRLMGVRARELVRERFTLDMMADKVAGVYRALGGLKPGRSK